jgi:hypothetical protein
MPVYIDFSAGPDGCWMMSVELDTVELATGLDVDLAHTYNCGDDYWTETHAVVNGSFSRVYLNSDAGSCGIDAEVHELIVSDVAHVLPLAIEGRTDDRCR